MSYRLPLIPLSPLIVASIETGKKLTKIAQKLSEAPESKLLKRRHQTIQDKLNGLTKSMETIQNGFLSDFDIKGVAQEIAYIDIQLLALVEPSWIEGFDERANLIPLLDFHRYLSHAFAHEILGSANPKTTITQLVQIASALFHHYHDLSGCSAILLCLQLPEIQRLNHVWDQCSTKTLGHLHTMLPLLSPAWRTRMRHTVVVVPWVQAHLESARLSISNLHPKLMSNPRIYHWLVSRAYLNRSQLIHESEQVLPRTRDERLEPTGEAHDFYWDFYQLEPQTVEPPVVPSAALSDSEEEWKGYPYEDEDDSEEEWKGYPSNPEDDEEEETENNRWNGYTAHLPNWQTPFDPWGKQDTLFAIEKTRRPQYALSTNIMTRRTLSSAFIPSSA